jgi:hypothetical protein
MVRATSPLVRFTASPVTAWTCTDSVSWPTPSEKSALKRPSALSCRPVRWARRKPSSSALTS